MVKFNQRAFFCKTTALLVAFGVFAGCASQNAIDNAVPAAAFPEARNSGAYPNINIVPTGETAQLSDLEAEAAKAALYAKADAQRRTGESAEAYLARLRRLQQLGSTHAAAALQAIEASN